MLNACTVFRFDSLDDVIFIAPMNRTGGQGEWLEKLCELAESKGSELYAIQDELVLIPRIFYPIWEEAAFELGGTMAIHPHPIDEGYYGPSSEPIHIQKGHNGGYYWVPNVMLSPAKYLAKINGKKKTEAKSEAARLNGKKGGRPRLKPIGSEIEAAVKKMVPIIPENSDDELDYTVEI